MAYVGSVAGDVARRNGAVIAAVAPLEKYSVTFISSHSTARNSDPVGIGYHDSSIDVVTEDALNGHILQRVDGRASQRHTALAPFCQPANDAARKRAEARVKHNTIANDIAQYCIHENTSTTIEMQRGVNHIQTRALKMALNVNI